MRRPLPICFTRHSGLAHPIEPVEIAHGDPLALERVGVQRADLIDLAAIVERRNDETIPWEQVKKELEIKTKNLVSN